MHSKLILYNKEQFLAKELLWGYSTFSDSFSLCQYVFFFCILFLEIGELLYFIMIHYTDVDVQDKARFYYSLLTGASDTKVNLLYPVEVLEGGGGNIGVSLLVPFSDFISVHLELYTCLH